MPQTLNPKPQTPNPGRLEFEPAPESPLAVQPSADKRSATINRRLRQFSEKGQFTRISHIPGGGGRPLLREGGQTSYEAKPSGFCRPDPGEAGGSRVQGPGCRVQGAGWVQGPGLP